MIYKLDTVRDYLDVLEDLAQNRWSVGPVIFVTDNSMDMLHEYYVPVEIHRCLHCGSQDFRFLCELPEEYPEPCFRCDGFTELVVGVDMVIRHNRVQYWRQP
jgi:hypothetical protein